MQPSRYALRTVADASLIIRQHTPLLEPETIDLADALGRVLATDVVADLDMPPFPSTLVDGYAVIASDPHPRRRVLTEITAGTADDLLIQLGTAARIMTGAPVPVGADAVIMVEHTQESDGYVTPLRPVRSGDNVRPVGLDMARGQVVLADGTVVGPTEIGLLATVGQTRLVVRRRPVVAVLSTGDELIEPDEPLRPGAIRDSNRRALLASIHEAGAVPLSLGTARDDEAVQEERIRAGLAQADALVTSGGVSVGSRDLVKPILERLGTVHFGRVSIKPGKPFTFATVEGRLAFGLPGFPVSSLVCFEVFVRPALLRMQGHPRPDRPEVRVILDGPVQPSPDRTEYQRVVITWRDGRLVARTTGIQVSSRLLSMAGANGLIKIEPGTAEIPAGATVAALLTGPLETWG
ncbi:MAG: molybdopterin molybdotransferase MoeA [Chloroflexi bacterium]|nr:molybdopterin molybdotransferase MoeA [Chloroflexota bacterium]